MAVKTKKCPFYKALEAFFLQGLKVLTKSDSIHIYTLQIRAFFLLKLFILYILYIFC
jgi:hypothetical protein